MAAGEGKQGCADSFRVDLASDAGFAGVECDGIGAGAVGGRPVLEQGLRFQHIFDPRRKTQFDQ